MRRWKTWIDREIAVLAGPTPTDANIGRLAGITRVRCKQMDRTFALLTHILRSHPALEARRGAAYVLSFWGERRSVAPLLRALQKLDEDEAVRGQAAEGLGYALEFTAHPLREKSIYALRAALSESSATIRFWSIFALGTMNAQEARGDLEALIGDVAMPEPRWWTVGDEAKDALVVLDGGIWPDRERRY